MRCKACNDILSDYEMRRKDSQGVFIDLCARALSETSRDAVEVDSIVSHGHDDTQEQIQALINRG
jgi:hypothetical protein